MYDLSGLYFKIIKGIFFWGGFGIILLIISRFWKLQKKNVETLILGICFVMIGIYIVGYHTYALCNLDIAVYEGTYSHDRRYRGYRHSYYFENEVGIKDFQLDVLSKRKICPEDFIKGMEYRIFYEEKTSIIVKVEKLE